MSGGTHRREARSAHRRWSAALLAASLALVFAGLGVWQVERRAWKLALIARVTLRVHADPVPAPDRSRWTEVNAADDEYRHVHVAGHWRNDATTRVQAVTEHGLGFWVLTPLARRDGSSVLVNRGFVPAAGPDRLPTAPAGEVDVTGLLRLSEPGGGFLRRNDPAAGRWYSRDVPAIAAARGLAGVAPYFIDAAASTGAPDRSDETDGPIAGLTVVAFRNDHLVYALTWFTLALMATAAAWHAGRDGDAAPASSA